MGGRAGPRPSIDRRRCLRPGRGTSWRRTRSPTFRWSADGRAASLRDRSSCGARINSYIDCPHGGSHWSELFARPAAAVVDGRTPPPRAAAGGTSAQTRPRTARGPTMRTKPRPDHSPAGARALHRGGLRRSVSALARGVAAPDAERCRLETLDPARPLLTRCVVPNAAVRRAHATRLGELLWERSSDARRPCSRRRQLARAYGWRKRDAEADPVRRAAYLRSLRDSGLLDRLAASPR